MSGRSINPDGANYDDAEGFLKHLVTQPASTLDRLADAAPEAIDVLVRLRQLQQFHGALSQYFPVDELETVEGYVSILMQNDNAEAQKEAGGFREKIIYLVDKASDEVIGGVNFAMFLGENARSENAATAHNVYTFVSKDYRQEGIASKLGDMIDQETGKYARTVGGLKSPSVFIFTEQNAPEKMTPYEYIADMEMAMDPCSRLKAWQKMGAQRLDFSYVQPPLDEGLEAVRMLTLNIHPPASESEPFLSQGLPPKVVENHLRMFVDISVVKEKGAFEQDADCQAMAAELSGKSSLAMIRDDIGLLQNKIYALFDLALKGAINPSIFAENGEERIGELLEQHKDLVAAQLPAITPERIREMQPALIALLASQETPLSSEPKPEGAQPRL